MKKENDLVGYAIKEHTKKLEKIFNINSHSLIDGYLYKELQKIENKAHDFAEHNCNFGVSDEEYDSIIEELENELDDILNFKEQKIPVLINTDPRGYALKIHDKYIRENNVNIYRDWGGYGILAPLFECDNN